MKNAASRRPVSGVGDGDGTGDSLAVDDGPDAGDDGGALASGVSIGASVANAVGAEAGPGAPGVTLCARATKGDATTKKSASAHVAREEID